MKTVIGLDYGTQAARAVLVNAADGTVLCSHSVRYPHGVMPGALASAQDYDDALLELLAAVTPPQYRQTVAGICVDATSLTLVPVGADGRVLSRDPTLAGREQAQIKLWKRHTAQLQAEQALQLARQRKEAFLGRTGGTISSEWTLPKLLEIRDEDPLVYSRLDLAFDLCEYLTWRLTGRLTRSVGSMSFKGLWAKDLGFPTEGFLDGLRPGFAAEYTHLLRGEVLGPGAFAGYMTPQLCRRLGLPQEVAVAAGVLDGHTALVSLGCLSAGDAALVLGTSNVLTIQNAWLREIEGICGIAADGLAPGVYGIDSGQACTGDMLEWYMENALPVSVWREAQEKGVSPHTVLMQRITQPWNCPVTAVDWWNGSRNAPCDLSLRGALTGLSLDTRPEDIYLALLQAIVCGTREILETCTAYGVHISRLRAAGGIAGKNPLLLQLYADLLGRPVEVGQVSEGPAVGSAIYAAVAAGIYATPVEAYEHIGVRDFVTCHPDEVHRADYEALWQKNHALRQSLQKK